MRPGVMGGHDSATFLSFFFSFLVLGPSSSSSSSSSSSALWRPPSTFAATTGRGHLWRDGTATGACSWPCQTTALDTHLCTDLMTACGTDLAKHTHTHTHICLCTHVSIYTSGSEAVHSTRAVCLTMTDGPSDIVFNDISYLDNPHFTLLTFV